MTQPPRFKPSSINVPHNFEREFSSVDIALQWLAIQGRTFPRMILCANALRPNIAEVMMRLERDLYPFGTAANEDYHIAGVFHPKKGNMAVEVGRLPIMKVKPKKRK